MLHNAATQLWDAALAETKSELEQLAQATNARIAEAQSERDDTLAELQTTAEELEQVKAERGAAQAESDSKTQQLATRAAEMATLQTELNTQTLATTKATHRAETAEAVRAELQTLLKTLMDKIGTVKDNNPAPAPHADRQNEDLFSDVSAEQAKPTPTPSKRRKTAK